VFGSLQTGPHLARFESKAVIRTTCLKRPLSGGKQSLNVGFSARQLPQAQQRLAQRDLRLDGGWQPGERRAFSESSGDVQESSNKRRTAKRSSTAVFMFTRQKSAFTPMFTVCVHILGGKSEVFRRFWRVCSRARSRSAFTFALMCSRVHTPIGVNAVNMNKGASALRDWLVRVRFPHFQKFVYLADGHAQFIGDLALRHPFMR